MSDQMRYTPGPWRIVEKGGGWREIWAGDRAVVRADGCYRAKYEDYECGVAISEPNAQRIVACVNACEGIPTESLEAGVVRKLIESATKTVLALLGRIEALEQERDAARAETERLTTENERLHRRVERLAAKIARQRAVISRLQAAVERRNSEERIEAMRRALHDETVERYMREYDAAADEAERWRQRYEALRAGVEQVARDLNARTRIHRQLLSHYHNGAADAYEEAEQWVRHLLSETGGGDT